MQRQKWRKSPPPITCTRSFDFFCIQLLTRKEMNVTIQGKWKRTFLRVSPKINKAVPNNFLIEISSLVKFPLAVAKGFIFPILRLSLEKPYKLTSNNNPLHICIGSPRESKTSSKRHEYSPLLKQSHMPQFHVNLLQLKLFAAAQLNIVFIHTLRLQSWWQLMSFSYCFINV